MKKTILVIIFVLSLLVDLRPAIAESAGNAEAISNVTLSEAALPLGMRISREIWASPQDLYRVRLRIGFPINALLNQTIVYADQQVKVNYLLPSNADWLRFGYSRLIMSDGDRSLIVSKESVIIQIAATTSELQELVARALQVDPIHYCKVRTNQLPEGWSIATEEYVSKGDIMKLEGSLSGKIQSAIVQEFIVKRTGIKIICYHCDRDSTAEELADVLAHRDNPLIKVSAESSGPIVVSAQSQDEELNGIAMSLVNLDIRGRVPGSE